MPPDTRGRVQFNISFKQFAQKEPVLRDGSRLEILRGWFVDMLTPSGVRVSQICRIAPDLKRVSSLG
jgi:hypothetical protein